MVHTIFIWFDGLDLAYHMVQILILEHVCNDFNPRLFYTRVIYFYPYLNLVIKACIGHDLTMQPGLPCGF